MPSPTNTALLALVDAVVEKANGLHAGTDCTAEKLCGFCQLRDHILQVATDHWDKENNDLGSAMEMLFYHILPDIPADKRKAGLEECLEKIDALIIAVGSDPEEPEEPETVIQ